MSRELPRFLPPMLATLGQPFDSDSHFFEFKWDGIRAQALIDESGCRMMSRNGLDISHQYAMVSILATLPRGLALDGELVAFKDGRPDFESVIGARSDPTTRGIAFVVFDILYLDYEPRVELPFTERRQLLEKTLGASPRPRMMLSEGIVGQGMKLYRTACDKSLEGVVAKRLSSSYAVGKRSTAWVKIKRRLKAHLAIIGFIEKGHDDFVCILVAGNGVGGEQAGPLRYLGRVGTGFDETARARVNGLLRSRPRAAPLVKCAERGQWVEPGLYCTVSFAELTSAGLLRAPVFEDLIEA